MLETIKKMLKLRGGKTIKRARTKMIRLQDDPKTTEEMMGQSEDGMGRCVWLSGWSRMSRKGYSIPQLEAVMAGSYVVVNDCRRYWQMSASKLSAD